MKGNFFYQRLGEKIYYARKKRRISQERLALLSDVDRTYIARIEGGRANPSLKVLNKICRVLKIQIDCLMPIFAGLALLFSILYSKW